MTDCIPRNAMRAMMTTTQAVDIIHGGIKVNALVSLHPNFQDILVL